LFQGEINMIQDKWYRMGDERHQSGISGIAEMNWKVQSVSRRGEGCLAILNNNWFIFLSNYPLIVWWYCVLEVVL